MEMKHLGEGFYVQLNATKNWNHNLAFHGHGTPCITKWSWIDNGLIIKFNYFLLIHNRSRLYSHKTSVIVGW